MLHSIRTNKFCLLVLHSGMVSREADFISLQEEDVDNESGEEVVPDAGLEIVGQAFKSLSMPAVSI